MSDFSTDYSLSFLLRHLPDRDCRIMEVGCGEGHLARALVDLGYEVAAVDSNADAVARACERGVNARHTVWPQFTGNGFDLVLFTRSLHHIHPLRHAVDRALEVLNDGGTIIIEDFDYTMVDATTVRWFAATIEMLQITGAMTRNDSWLNALVDSRDTMDVWHSNHEHDLNPFTAIEDSVGVVFERVSVEPAAYFFRYIGNAVGETERLSKVQEGFARLEEKLIATGTITSLGKRLVAQKAE
jgi:SAM-dependent methyltransferase